MQSRRRHQCQSASGVKLCEQGEDKFPAQGSLERFIFTPASLVCIIAAQEVLSALMNQKWKINVRLAPLASIRQLPTFCSRERNRIRAGAREGKLIPSLISRRALVTRGAWRRDWFRAEHIARWSGLDAASPRDCRVGSANLIYYARAGISAGISIERIPENLSEWENLEYFRQDWREFIAHSSDCGKVALTAIRSCEHEIGLHRLILLSLQCRSCNFLPCFANIYVSIVLNTERYLSEMQAVS